MRPNRFWRHTWYTCRPYKIKSITRTDILLTWADCSIRKFANSLNAPDVSLSGYSGTWHRLKLPTTPKRMLVEAKHRARWTSVTLVASTNASRFPLLLPLSSALDGEVMKKWLQTRVQWVVSLRQESCSIDHKTGSFLRKQMNRVQNIMRL